MKKRLLLPLLLAAALLLAACGSEKTPPEETLNGTWGGVSDPTESVTFQDGKGYFSYKGSDYIDGFEYTLNTEEGKIIIPCGDSTDQIILYTVSGQELTLTFAEGFGDISVKTYKK